VPQKRSDPDPTTPPNGWVTRDELVAATGVGDRNLLNWCARGFVPRPMRRFLGGGRGTAAFYRAESVAIIRRLHELQQQGRDANAWLWGLWLDPANYPVDIRPWLLRRLDHDMGAIKAIGDDPDRIERHVGDGLRHGRVARKLRQRGINPSRLHDLMLWAYRVAADIEQQERLDNPGSPILETLRKVGGLPDRGFPAPDRKLGVELMSVAWLKEVVEKASPDELEQIRRDCRAIDHLAEVAAGIDWRAMMPAIRSVVRSITGDRQPEPPSIRARKEARKRPPVPAIVRSLLSMWTEFDSRAFLIASVISWRQLPEYRTRLTELLVLAVSALELFPRLPSPNAASLVRGTGKLRFAHARR
jgi:hypothetical protein